MEVYERGLKVLNKFGGEILEVLELRTGRLKILKLAEKHGYLGKVDRELRTLRRIQTKPHPLIVRWFGVMELQGETYMVLEHLRGPSLKVWLSEAGVFDKILARFYSSCLLSALEHLHFVIGTTHGDLHLGNAVLDKFGYAVLIDFGSSEEVKYGNSISYGTDIKDFGHCIFQMLTLQNQFTCGWKPHAAILDDDTLELLTQTTSSSPSSSLKGIKKDRFFWGINWTDLFMRRIKPPPLLKREVRP